MSNLKYPAIAAFCVVLLAAGIGLDMYFKPHRDIKSVEVFQEFGVDDFITEFIDDPAAAKDKYLAENGDSKVVAMTGTIVSIETNLGGKTVIELKGEKQEARARFTLLEDQSEAASKLKVGDQAKITGMVSAGPEFDSDFNHYLDAVLEQAYF